MRPKHRFVFLAAVTLILLAACDRPTPAPEMVWERSYGSDTTWCEAVTVAPAPDGGFFVAGTFQPPSWLPRIWLLRTSDTGDTIWTKTFCSEDRSGVSRCYDAELTADGGLIILGTIADSSTGYFSSATYVVKTNSSGDTVWTRTLFSDPHVAVYSITQATDGGYYLAALPYSGLYGPVTVIALDTAGTVRWTRTYWGDCSSSSVEIAAAPGGGFVLASSTAPSNYSETRATVLCGGSAGDSVWAFRTDISGYTTVGDIQPTRDGGFIIGGSQVVRQFLPIHEHRYFYLLKLNANGELDWERGFGAPEHNIIRSIYQTSDGGYVFTGHTSDGGSGECVVRTDANGEQQWLGKVAGIDGIANSACPTADGDIVVAGHTHASSDTHMRLYVARISPP